MSSYTPITHSTTAPPPSTNLDYISRAKHRLYATFSARRPWRQLFDHHSLSFPQNLSDALTHLKINLSYFRMNYAIIILLILFLSLLWHPFSLIVFFAMMIAWVFLYFLRDEPLVFFGRFIDDRVVLTVLSVFTVGFLLLTGATANILISLAVGVGVVTVYSVFRQSDDLFLDEEDAVAGGLLAGRNAVYHHQQSTP